MLSARRAGEGTRTRTQGPARQRALGADLRALRRARALTLAELAGRLGRSVGWLSQVERDLSVPTLDDLRTLAAALQVSADILLRPAGPPGERGLVVRPAGRRPVGARVPGLTEELLSPDLTDAFEVLHCTFAPGAALCVPHRRATQEVGYIVSGALDLVIGGALFRLGPGDSFRIRGESFSWSNPHDQPCVAIWTIAPPVY